MARSAPACRCAHPASGTRRVRTPCGRKPGLTARSRRKLRTSKPALISTTTARATSAMTRAPRMTRPPRLAVPPREVSESAAFRLIAEACRAGRMPKRMPVATAAARANRSTRPSMAASRNCGIAAGPKRCTRTIPKRATSRPSNPPARESTKLSDSSCATIWLRDAPMANRTAISLRREAPRASSRLATLAQAIRSSRPTAPLNTSSGWRVSPESSSRMGYRLGRKPALSA